MDALKRAASASAGDAHALPFSAYSDPAVFELEMERIFRRDWLPVCADVDLPEAGDYVALTIAQEPVVVLRGSDGELRALSNVCRHRGTILLDEGRGKAAKLTCPYHAWAYDHAGKLLGVPHPGNVKIDKAAHSLPAFPLEVWGGFVWVALSPDVEPLARRVAGMERYLGGYGLAAMTQSTGVAEPRLWNANWKLIMENGIESYHLFRVHRETLEPYSPTAGAFYLEGSAPWTLTAGETTRMGRKADADFESGHYTLVSIPPGFVSILSRDSFGFLSVLPVSPDQTLVTGGSISVPHDAASAKAAAEFTAAFLEEDRMICERGQRGMRSRAGKGGQLVELERVVVDFHQYWGWRLFGSEPDKPFTSAEARKHFGAS